MLPQEITATLNALISEVFAARNAGCAETLPRHTTRKKHSVGPMILAPLLILPSKVKAHRDYALTLTFLTTCGHSIWPLSASAKAHLLLPILASFAKERLSKAVMPLFLAEMTARLAAMHLASSPTSVAPARVPPPMKRKPLKLSAVQLLLMFASFAMERFLKGMPFIKTLLAVKDMMKSSPSATPTGASPPMNMQPLKLSAALKKTLKPTDPLLLLLQDQRRFPLRKPPPAPLFCSRSLDWLLLP